MALKKMRATLSVGGTGMLGAATRWAASQSEVTYVVARHASAFTTDLPSAQPIDLDWNHPDFQDKFSNALIAADQIEWALLWVHQPDQILPWLLPQLKNARTVVVLGSTDGIPEIPLVNESPAYVRLGSKNVSGNRRWLTHNEISRAAIEALKDGQSRIVGELQPL